MFEQSVMLHVQHLNMVIDKYEKKSDTKYRRGCTHKVNSHRSIIPLKNVGVNFTMIYYFHVTINRYAKCREMRTPTFVMDDDRTR